jgi:hypothetical protein
VERRFIKDYDLVIEGDGKKRLQYNGQLRQVLLPEGEYRRIKKEMLVLAVSNVIIFIGLGLAGEEATRHISVGLPFALLVIPVAVLMFKAVRVVKLKTEWERRDYESAFMPQCVYAGWLLCAGLAACAADVFWLSQAVNPGWHEYVFAPLAALLTLGAWAYLRRWNRLRRGLGDVAR